MEFIINIYNFVLEFSAITIFYINGVIFSMIMFYKENQKVKTKKEDPFKTHIFGALILSLIFGLIIGNIFMIYSFFKKLNVFWTKEETKIMKDKQIIKNLKNKIHNLEENYEIKLNNLKSTIEELKSELKEKNSFNIK